MSEERVIWKWTVPIQEEVTLEMPAGARVLSFQLQGDTPTLWALVAPGNPKEPRRFRVVGTGDKFPYSETGCRYLGTVQDPRALTRLKLALVWHLFELLEGA